MARNLGRPAARTTGPAFRRYRPSPASLTLSVSVYGVGGFARRGGQLTSTLRHFGEANLRFNQRRLRASACGLGMRLRERRASLRFSDARVQPVDVHAAIVANRSDAARWWVAPDPGRA